MSTPLVLCDNFTLFNRTTNSLLHNHHSNSSSLLLQLLGTSTTSTSSTRRGRGLSSGFIPNAKNNDNRRSGNKKRAWWKNFFLDEDANWLGLKEQEEMLLEEEEEEEDDPDIPTSNNNNKGEKFEAWKRRAEAITELRQAQQDAINQQDRNWEDWLVEQPPSQLHDSYYYSTQDWDDRPDRRVEEEIRVDDDMMPEKGLVKSLRDIVLGKEEDDLLYEDRVFQYASSNSAKFLALLVIIPWSLDFVVHDFVLMPFLDRYVKLVPLASELLDVRRPQKLEMVKTLKVEKARLRFEAEIGKAPPLSDEEAWLELRHRALELRDEWRLENRKAFANIWSDMVFGIAVFILLYFNQSKVALLKFTGYKIINNVTDTGKAFLIILITDIFLGYHSESGWQTLLEILVEHYGLEVDQSAITLFICLVPVLMDACVKLWLFKFLPRLSPKVSNIFREMKRH